MSMGQTSPDLLPLVPPSYPQTEPSVTLVSSPFARVLETAYVPSDEDISAIQDHLWQPLKQIDSLDEQIKGLNNELAMLNARRDALLGYISAHEAVTSLSRRIPSDILAEVFFHCLPTSHDPVCDISQPPLLLTRVCRTWRNVAVSTPRLWSQIHVVVPDSLRVANYDKLIPARCTGIRAWLTRSGMRPLTITLLAGYFYSPGYAKPPPDFSSLIVLLLEFSKQWKDVTLTLSSETIPTLSLLGQGDFPLLESLEIKENGFGSGNVVDHTLLDFAQSAPLLRKLALGHSSLNLRTLSMPKQQLTHLALNSCHDTDTREILIALEQCCHTLETLFLGSAISQWRAISNEPIYEDSTFPAPLRMLKLHTLSITSTADRLVHHDLCRYLLVPQLIELCYKDDSPPMLSSVTTNAFTPMLQRSVCSLKTLDYRACHGTDNLLIEILACSPSLTTLRVGDASPFNWPPSSDNPHSFSDNVLKALMLPTDYSSATPSLLAPALCPMLEDVVFETCAFTETALIEMIRSRVIPRANTLACLKRVHVIFPATVQPGDHYGKGLPSIVEILRQEGLEITLKYPPPPDNIADDCWLGIDRKPCARRQPWLNYTVL